MMNTICLNLSNKEILFIIILVVWELVRKAIALYKAGQRGEKIRFVLIFIFNTCGILPILYRIIARNKNK